MTFQDFEGTEARMSNNANPLRLEIQSVKYDPEYLKLCAAIGMWVHQADPEKFEELAEAIK